MMIEWGFLIRLRWCQAIDTQAPLVGFPGRNRIMGKGDKRSKRGKLFKGTFGKRRIKPQKAAKKIRDAAASGS